MKKGLFIIIGIISVQISHGQKALEELKNSMERAEGGSGCQIEYSVHLTSTTVKSYYAKDFDTGVLVEVNGKPLYYELTKKVGEEKETVILNIERAAIIEFTVGYVKGKCRYQFEFYY